VIHSRSTNLYGVVDNDDFFDFAGGLNLATKQVNGGAAPEFYVANLRKAGRERLEEFRSFLAAEMSGRFFNPKWIREMQRSGYSGAREIFDHLENVYGWQATTPEQVDGSYWERSYQVYVQDQYQLGLKEFFEKENPHARQYMLARMLEVDRQGSYQFTPEQRAQMLREYARSVVRFGVGCSANTCGNRRLQEAVAAAAVSVAGLSAGELERFRAALQRAYAPRRAAPLMANAAGVGKGMAGRRAALGARQFRLFSVSMPSLEGAGLLVPLGVGVFVLFLASSGLLGAAQAAWLRRRGAAVAPLDLSGPAD
jgi:cobaltochelatase CobN